MYAAYHICPRKRRHDVMKCTQIIRTPFTSLTISTFLHLILAGLLAMYKAFSGTRKAPFDRAISSVNDGGALRTALK